MNELHLRQSAASHPPQAGSSRGGPDGVDNPDQRISSDVASFTDTALSLSLTLLNALIDLVSFSGILFSIYPPLFIALVTYSIGGTAVSLGLGKVSCSESVCNFTTTRCFVMT